MVRRFLEALNYPNFDKINVEDETTFKNIVVWLETTKINAASRNTLYLLKNINDRGWDKSFDLYKNDVGCPVLESRVEYLQWLLGKAVQIETSKNKALYLKHSVNTIKSSNVPNMVAENPLDKLDFGGKEFTLRINQLAKSLKIVPYPDPLVTLKAVRKVITTRLAPDCVENPQNYILTGTPFPYEDADLGFDLNDPVLNKAAKILRMLYIHDLRDLQTKANEMVVAIQNITANPKTDTKLGKVGR
ncbi:RNA transcription, translation and transport factor protein [Cylas formicarius]|uniref:RNA transcription, translation and transport factor protein n=1 Tax=Cylas formicarius TaxID=197179 RepID=UPI0029584834|nr:RNA transcription, translation and transport factor protein [Cylas formicarius]